MVEGCCMKTVNKSINHSFIQSVSLAFGLQCECPMTHPHIHSRYNITSHAQIFRPQLISSNQGN
jgi:hypothetical protein